jgi:hypothetical protein
VEEGLGLGLRVEVGLGGDLGWGGVWEKQTGLQSIPSDIFRVNSGLGFSDWVYMWGWGSGRYAEVGIEGQIDGGLVCRLPQSIPIDVSRA